MRALVIFGVCWLILAAMAGRRLRQLPQDLDRAELLREVSSGREPHPLEAQQVGDSCLNRPDGSTNPYAERCEFRCPCHEPEWCADNPAVGCDLCRAWHGHLMLSLGHPVYGDDK